VDPRDLELPTGFWPSVHGIVGEPPWPPSSRASADRFLEECAWHGLLPLLQASRERPAEVSEALRRARAWGRAFALRARVFERELARLQDLLRGETFILLKGADYAERLYGSFELRPMEDIDLLVPADRYADTCARLSAAGLPPLFRGTPSTRADSYYERAFQLGSIPIEVHHAFIQRPRHTIDYSAIWQRAVPGRAGALRLSDADALAYQALTIGVDQFHVRLARYVDFWLLLRSAPGLLAAGAARAREWKSVHAYYGACRLAGRLFPELATPEVAATLEASLSPPTRRFLDAWVLPGAAEMGGHALPARPLQLWRKFALMDNTVRRCSFLAHHLAADLAGRLAQWREGAVAGGGPPAR
jgi:hypothetical protein